jgi:hypothetical protein
MDSKLQLTRKRGVRGENQDQKLEDWDSKEKILFAFLRALRVSA